MRSAEATNRNVSQSFLFAHLINFIASRVKLVQLGCETDSQLPRLLRAPLTLYCTRVGSFCDRRRLPWELPRFEVITFQFTGRLRFMFAAFFSPLSSVSRCQLKIRSRLELTRVALPLKQKLESQRMFTSLEDTEKVCPAIDPNSAFKKLFASLTFREVKLFDEALPHHRRRKINDRRS